MQPPLDFRRLGERVLPWLAVIALLVLIAALQGGPIDDAYIFCRYAQNLLSGHGAVFNIGERVEGYTSPVHLLVVTLAGLLGAKGPAGAWLSSLLPAAGLLLLLPHLLTAAQRAAGARAALLTVAAMPWAAWAGSGMDAPLFSLAVLAAALAFDSEKRGRWLVLGLPALVRPEGLALVALGWCWPVRGPPRRWGQILSARVLGALPFGALSAFRRLYYHAWLPNTFYAKVGGGTLSLWTRGLGYLADGILVLLPLVVAAALALRSPEVRRGRAFSALCALALMGATVFEGGDYFPFQRFLLPVIPLLAVLAAEFVSSLGTFGRQSLATGFLAGVLGVWTWFAPTPFSPNGQPQRERLANEVASAALWDSVGVALEKELGPDHSIALVPAGAIPFRTRWPTVDMVGLNDARIARVAGNIGHGVAAHEKFDSEYVLDRHPEFIYLNHHVVFGSRESQESVLESVWMQANEDLARSPRFRAEYHLWWLELAPLRYVALFRRNR